MTNKLQIKIRMFKTLKRLQIEKTTKRKKERRTDLSNIFKNIQLSAIKKATVGSQKSTYNQVKMDTILKGWSAKKNF